MTVWSLENWQLLNHSIGFSILPYTKSNSSIEIRTASCSEVGPPGDFSQLSLCVVLAKVFRLLKFLKLNLFSPL